ncbi:NUDIX hydrolase [Brachybacterium phenoliresistens]|uniref:NUDIX hydrolase n=1 Tax=Brachybacterium phenoliresistens TaxID=396014 RepID=Z9JU80_9MICO|nr:NUDIX hydrolase [Brachybacterium phenoliresistens]EWS81356.1 NUDIX hydrolase [Brachybacterium phenoliresistens]
MDPIDRPLTDYPRPSVAVDTAVLTVRGAELYVGLVPGRPRLPGAFLHEGETLAGAVRRSLAQKAGLEGVAPAQLHVFDALDRDSRGWVLSVAHVVVVPAESTGALELVPTSAATGLDFDHDAIVEQAARWIRDRYVDHPDPEHLLGPELTLRDLRRVHEAVHGAALQPDTFRRAMLPRLEPTGQRRRGDVGKPAQLFRRR